MTQWFPNAEVVINGTSRTSLTVNSFSVTYGRGSFWEQPRAGYASIEILNVSNTHYPFAIGQTVSLTVDNTAGTPITVFTGKIATIENSIQANGVIGTNVLTKITAYSPLTEMARATIAAKTWPKEYDDDRMLAILTEAGVTIDVVDTPGVYEFHSAAQTTQDAYTVASYYAKMAFGYIYETTDGKIGYANESHRLNDSVANGYMSISKNDLLWSGIASKQILENLVNDVLLTYKNAQTVTAQNLSSQANYGIQAAKIDTQLEQGVEAQIQADRYVAMLGRPETSLSALAIPLDSNEIADADRDELLTVYLGKPIQIAGLPNQIYDGTYQGFVEGWNLRVSQTQALLVLTSTEKSLSIVPTRWQDVPALTAWDDVDPTIEWFNYP